MEIKSEALRLHEDNRGKIEICSKVKLENADDLSLAYTPGVAEPCREIQRDPSLVNNYTNKGNTVAVISDGTAVLGLGDIGPEAALPVMEGKAILFKTFAKIDAIPICLGTKNADEIIETVIRLAPTFGGVNLEDISAPRCFKIEEEIISRVGIPVFHDDQHGTGVVCLAGLLNALRVVDKKIDQVKIVINGAGSAGQAIARLLWTAGARQIKLCDLKGILSPDQEGINSYQKALAQLTNPEKVKGDLPSALKGADVFIGVSAANILSSEMVKQMAPQPVLFAMANPEPEISPEEAKRGGAAIIGTGRSDYPNQVNNILGFPGIFRGALDVQAKRISKGMMLAAAYAIASLISQEELATDYVIPSPFDPRVVPAVAYAVGSKAIEEGLAKLSITKEDLKKNLIKKFGNW